MGHRAGPDKVKKRKVPRLRNEGNLISYFTSLNSALSYSTLPLGS